MTFYTESGDQYKLEFVKDGKTITIYYKEEVWNSWTEEREEEVQSLHLTLEEARQLCYELSEILY